MRLLGALLFESRDGRDHFLHVVVMLGDALKEFHHLRQPLALVLELDGVGVVEVPAVEP
ncbi:hypothetical protein [Paraburkholderia caribensis]|uniref:hypothetical protein n=1 Tax=Paraburkholderia caribensis TaxID=75105 RepID=UPI001D064337|nr:hypothetical protein [Paraburkholderia caribensis]